MKRYLVTFSTVLLWLFHPTLSHAGRIIFFDVFPGKQINSEKWDVSNNNGIATIERGSLVLDDSGHSSPYPFIDSKLDPFTNKKEYKVEVRFRFEGESGDPYGIAFAVSHGEQPQDQPFGNSPYSNNRNFWMKLQGDFTFGFGQSLVAIRPYDNEWHNLIFERKNSTSTIYFDGESLGTSTLNWSPPTNIWFGLTNSLGFGPNQYPKLILKSIFVR